MYAEDQEKIINNYFGLFSPFVVKVIYYWFDRR